MWHTCAFLIATIFAGQCVGKKSVPKFSQRPTLIASDSQVLPLIDDLHSVANPPKDKDLKLSKLTKILGDDFDPAWMSINEPRNKNIDVVELTDEELIQEFRNLSMKYRDENGNRVRLSDDTEAVLEKWLTQKANCPIQYTWVDLGQLFWPRWVKRGECIQRKCSWPSGMQCSSSDMMTIRPLRWHCIRKSKRDRREKRGSSKFKCRWIPVPYPMTSKCSCQCKD